MGDSPIIAIMSAMGFPPPPPPPNKPPIIPCTISITSGSFICCMIAIGLVWTCATHTHTHTHTHQHSERCRGSKISGVRTPPHTTNTAHTAYWHGILSAESSQQGIGRQAGRQAPYRTCSMMARSFGLAAIFAYR